LAIGDKVLERSRRYGGVYSWTKKIDGDGGGRLRRMAGRAQARWRRKRGDGRLVVVDGGMK